MPTKLEEVAMRFEYEVCRFDDTTAIIECSQANGPATLLDCGTRVKVEAEPDEMKTGLEYRFWGRWSNHPKYGRQFIAKTFVRAVPHDRRGVVRYLCQAPNIGMVWATRMWENFKGEAVKTLRESPDVASTATGLSEAKCNQAAEWLRKEEATENATIAMMNLLDGRGFPKSTTKRAIKLWGNRAAEFVEKNPHILMAFRGCGFVLCDKLYLELGLDPSRLKRQALCAWYAIARDTSGSTWHQPLKIERGLRERIGAACVRDVDAVKLAIRGRLLASHRDGQGRLWLAQRKKADAEETVAARVRQWLSAAPEWPDPSALELSGHQRERLTQALTRQISVFSGGPGTGKTYSAARLIAKILQIHGTGILAVAAPTGKAAVRITEAMLGYGIKIRATTIHGLLGVCQKSDGEGWGFEHNRRNPLPQRFVVVDEASMVDTDLAAALFDACGTDTHLLLVGDTGQLPPVGHGAPLRDLTRAGVPTGHLTEIRRNSGMIVQACHAIREGSQFPTAAEIDPATGQNIKLVPAAKAETAMSKIVSMIETIGHRGIADPIWGCQVIVAVNNKSELSRVAVNRRMQAELNPKGKKADGNPFRVRDKVVCTKNKFVETCNEKDAAAGKYPESVERMLNDADEQLNATAQDGKVFVANGEQGEVVEVETKRTFVRLESPARLVLIPRGTGGKKGDDEKETSTGCEWELAYAISCHKSQGSEWPIVFVVLDDYGGAQRICTREWLYTAPSRARVACFLVGKISTAYGMLKNVALDKRKTLLTERIRHETDE